MRVRLTVEYDPDWPDSASPTEIADALFQEHAAWVKGDVSVVDVLDVQGLGPTNLKVEVVNEA